MKKIEIVLCDSNNDGNFKYRYTVLDSMGRVVVMTSNLALAEMFFRR